MKEYFNVIQNPLSLKALQKLVKGIHGRKEATGVSEFKGWAAFEEKASLLWNNAHYFNEEGSEIYNQATELKVSKQIQGWWLVIMVDRARVVLTLSTRAGLLRGRAQQSKGRCPGTSTAQNQD